MKLFVWDFHGVLEKDTDLAVFDISNQVLEQQGYSERFTTEENRKFFGLKWYEYFERLLPGLTNEQHLALQAACFKFVENDPSLLAAHVKPNDHAVEVVEAINKTGHDQIIISNSRPGDILWFVKTVGLENNFPDSKVFGVNSHQTHGNKKDALAHYLKNNKFDDVVIIGDSAGDMALKEVKGGVTYFYSHPHLKLDKQIKADYVITDLRNVLKELNTGIMGNAD